MAALDTKVWRELWRLRSQLIAICLVIACGAATFVMSLTTLDSLRGSLATYYERYRFAHVFGQLKRAPRLLEQRLATIPGVAQVQTRILSEVTVGVEGMEEPAVGRLLSLPAQGSRLNRLYVRRGRLPEPGRSEAVVSEPFADAHGLGPGDAVTATINGRHQRLQLSGVVLSPEYLIQMRGTELVPDDKRFGVFWLPEAELAAAMDMEGAFNDVSLQLLRGAQPDEVIRRLDGLTGEYGAVGAYARKRHLSHSYISDEIRQLRGMGLITPIIFLCVAGFLLNVVMSRLITTQREQIAALKAFGYTRGEIGRHYLKLVLAIVVIGAGIGCLVGIWLGRNLTSMYTQFYRFPVLGYRVRPWIPLVAVVVSSLAGVLGTLRSVFLAVSLPPAEAMRPEPPRRYRPTLIERMGLGRLLPNVFRMILRQLERRPLRSLLSCLGIATGVAVVILGNFMLDSLDFIMRFQFELAQRHDMSVTFFEPVPQTALHELAQLPGVRRCEGFRALPTRLRAGPRSRRVGIMGLERDARLFRLIDTHEQPVAVASEGLLLSSKLAELLEVGSGDVLRCEVLEGERRVVEIPVSGLITEYGGTNAYMERKALSRLMAEAPLISGAFLSVDPQAQSALNRRLRELPAVASVGFKRAAWQSFKKTIAENLTVMQSFNLGFALIIALGVVYNTARISLAERSRELATLRVIGFTQAEVSAIIAGELLLLTALAIPLGWALGTLFAWGVSLGLDTEIYRIPLVVSRATYAFAALVVGLGSLASSWLVRRRIGRLDLIAVLKTKE